MLENRPPNISHLDVLIEEFLKLLLSKRRTRQLSSDSSLDTSPEPKKLRECDNPLPKATETKKVTTLFYLL